MSTSLFEQFGTGTFSPTEHSLGPWGADLLHGGPVAALLAHQLLASAADGEWFPARLTVDLMRPVSMSPLEVSTTIVRAGRKAKLIGAECHGSGAQVARATLQLIARGDVPIPLDSPAHAWLLSGAPSTPEGTPVALMSATTGETSFHRSSVEHRSRKDLNGGLGPGSDWIRVSCDLLPGEPLAPFERAVCAADFSNGISSSLPFEKYTYVNADLTLNLFRLPVDEWVLVDAISHIGEHGIGLAESTLFDREGLLGHACQSLVVNSR